MIGMKGEKEQNYKNKQTRKTINQEYTNIKHQKNNLLYFYKKV